MKPKIEIVEDLKPSAESETSYPSLRQCEPFFITNPYVENPYREYKDGKQRRRERRKSKDSQSKNK